MPVTLERKRQRLVAAVIREQKKVLRKRIVGDRRGGGRVCFDRGTLQSGRAFKGLTLNSLRRDIIYPALIHAFLKTGLIITAETIQSAKSDDLKVWYEAVADYFETERQAKVGTESQAYH
jgi:hypothetical protein